MFEIARLFVFVLFLGLGLLIAIARTERARRLATNLFLLYTLIVSVTIGVFQLDAWPFSTYRLANQTWLGTSMKPYSKVRFFAFDAAGKEWEVDPAAWSPIFPVVLQFYFRDIFPTLDTNQRAEAGRFLSTRAEMARQSLRKGEYFGNERLLGPLTAPDWALYARYREVPDHPWVGIRVYRETWKPAERVVDPTRFTRSLVLEYAGR
jgi:hypothetical protein